MNPVAIMFVMLFYFVSKFLCNFGKHVYDPEYEEGKLCIFCNKEK